MNEGPERTTPAQDAMAELATMAAEIRRGTQQYWEFLGKKGAREVMDELGILETIENEEIASVLEEVMGKAVVCGLVLSMKDTISVIDIDDETLRLLQPAPDAAEFVAILISKMIKRGISFHRDELLKSTAKSRQWLNEFSLLLVHRYGITQIQWPHSR